MLRVPASLVAILLIAFTSFAARSEDLAKLLSEGQVRIDALRGNGASSGFSLEGVLQNLSSAKLRIAVSLQSPLFFVNSHQGQDMLGVAVVELDGSYYEDSSGPFLELNGNATLPIAFIAYCVDFEKDNPSANNRFSVSTVPSQISSVARAIRDEEANNIKFRRDSVVASQLALWLAQGVSRAEISERFPFTPQDEQRAQEILQRAY